MAEDAVSIRFGSPQRVSLRSVENPCAEPTSNIVSISVGRYSSADAENVQSNHRTYSVNVWIKVGRECRNRPGNCSSEVLRTGRAFAGRDISCRVFRGIVPGCCLAVGNSTTGPGDGSADSLLSGCLSWSEECQLLAVHRSFRLRPEGRGRSFLVSWCTWFRRRILRWR